jgi:energy-coupling factor transport system ATP-binding protein
MVDMVKVEKITYQYTSEDDKEIAALNNTSLNINKGEFVVIIGHNGSGKSTLAKHINALLVPTKGKVYINSMDTSKEDQLWDIRKSAGMVFQNPDNQIVATIVEEDVAFGPENLGVESKEIRRRVDEALSVVEMQEYKKHAPHLLSGGQKQRIAIAGILAMKPDCIVFDESTAMLDPSGRKEVLNTIKKLNKEEGITIIHITHFMDEAIDADRVMVMEMGEVVMEGSPKEVFSQVTKLKNLGLDVPQVTDLCYQLRQQGIDIPQDILSVDEMVIKLCQLL